MHRAHHGWISGLGGALALTAAVLLTGVTGCPDPAGKLDEFLDDTKDTRDVPPPKEDIGSQLEDVSGTFLMAVASVIDPAHPLQFIATQTMTPDGDGGLLTLSLQPLSLEQGSTTMPRMPVGTPIDIADIPVSAEGRYAVPVDVAGTGKDCMADGDCDAGLTCYPADSAGQCFGFLNLNVTGEANPITGSDIEVELRYVGFIQSADFLCGNITGNVLSPIMADLSGSSFSAIRIEDTSPMGLPEPIADFPVGCE